MSDGGRRVLIVGISSFWGYQLARQLERDQSVEYIAGIDLTPPKGDLERTEFLEADIRSPVITRLIPSTKADILVHAGAVFASEGSAPSQIAHETNVIGSLQLLSACEKTPQLKTVIVRSSGAIYGASATAPSFLSEDMTRAVQMRTKYQRDSAEFESYFETFARRYQQITCTVLRFQPAIGLDIDTPLTRYLSTPVVPTQLGFDPRLQFLHSEDGVSALLHALKSPLRGPVNIAGRGAISLSRLLRRAGKITVPILPPLFAPLLNGAGRLGVAAMPSDLVALLRYGRVLDTERMEKGLGFKPRYTTEEAVKDFTVKRGSHRLVSSVREVVLGGG